MRPPASHLGSTNPINSSLSPFQPKSNRHTQPQDTAYVLSRFNSLILARVFGHRDVEVLSQFSAVPGTHSKQPHATR